MSSNHVYTLSDLYHLSPAELKILINIINTRTVTRERPYLNSLAKSMMGEELTTEEYILKIIKYLPKLEGRKGYDGLKKLLDDWWKMASKLDEAIVV